MSRTPNQPNEQRDRWYADDPEPMDDEAGYTYYPVQVSYGSTRYADCRRCKMPVYFYSKGYGKRIPLDPRFVLGTRDGQVERDGMRRDWIYMRDHRQLCDGAP